MLNDLDTTLRELLLEELPKAQGDIAVAFEQPKGGWTAQKVMAERTVNLFLYDVKENVQLRRHDWEHWGNGNGADQHFAKQKKPPLRLDCFYMVTTWAADPEVEHWLLSACLLVLARYPTLPQDRLRGSLQNQPYEIRTKLAAHDVLTNPAEVWGALGNDLRPSISYVVSLALDPWRPIEVPVVTTAQLRIGQIQSKPMEKKTIVQTSATPDEAQTKMDAV